MMIARAVKLCFLHSLFAFSFVFAPATGLMAQSKEPAAIPAAQLQSFATAAKQVLEIRQRYTLQIQAADSEQEARAAFVAAQGEMRKAIETSGLSVERYEEITEAAEADPKLADEIRGTIEKADKK